MVKTPVVLKEANNLRCVAPPAQAVGEGQPYFGPIRPKRKIACTRKITFMHLAGGVAQGMVLSE